MFLRGMSLLIILLLVGCVTAPPTHVDSICKIFRQYPRWYWDTQASQKKWGIPINVQMAILRQESSFNAKAKPPRTKLLWFIPWKRPSSAYGYTQALNETWDYYKHDSGRKGADRDNFKDAVDFIGWYGNRAHQKAGIQKDDAFRLYLAYHEGTGGYLQRSYANKSWLLRVARKVNTRAYKYQQQLNQCQSHLKKKSWYYLW